jgi:hypothetical protein
MFAMLMSLRLRLHRDAASVKVEASQIGKLDKLGREQGEVSEPEDGDLQTDTLPKHRDVPERLDGDPDKDTMTEREVARLDVCRVDELIKHRP